MVVDTSVLLSIFFKEKHAEWAAAQLTEHAASLLMSTVNLTETLIRIADRQPALSTELETEILNSGIQFVAPDVQQARLAAQARLRFPINLGDCFVYALAVTQGHPILALDADFRRVDHEVVFPS